MAKIIGLPDGTEAEFPDSMSDADISSVLRKQFGGGPSTQAQPQVQQPPQAQPTEPTMGEAAKGFVTGLPEGVYNEVVMMGKALASPIESVQGIYSLMKGAFGQDPSIQSTPEDRSNFMALSDYYKNKYGSMAGFKQAMINEPASILSDASMVLSGGAGLAAKVPKLGKVAKAAQIASRVDPLNIAYQTAAAPGRLLGRTALPEKMWTSVAKPAKKFQGGEPQIFEEAARQKIMPTQKGLLGASGAEAAQDLWEAPHKEVTGIAREATESGVVLPRQDVIFEGVYPEVQRLSKAAGTKAKQSVIMREAKDFMEKYGEVFTPDELLEIKRATSSEIKTTDWKQKGANLETAKMTLEDGMRRALEKMDPRLKELNKDVQVRKMLDEVVKDASSRIGKNNIFGLGDYLVGTGGGIGVGTLASFGRTSEALTLAAVIGARGILSNPRVKSRLAIAMRRGATAPVEQIPAIAKMAALRATQRDEQYGGK